MAETARLQPERVPGESAFWDRQARSFSTSWPAERMRSDPFLAALRRHTPRTGTALDVGAGAGRFTLTLAPHVGGVTALDASPAMLRALRRRSREDHITNVTTVVGRWPEVQVEPADVCFSSFVMTLVADGAAFVAAMDAAARRRVLLYLGAYSNDALLDPLWRHFHGRPRCPGPTYLDALGVIRQLGIQPAVRVVPMASRSRFVDLDEAVKEYANALMVPKGRSPKAELRQLLSHWLVSYRGHLVPPVRTIAGAIIDWIPGQR